MSNDGMRRRNGEYEPILNVAEAKEIGRCEKDGFSGIVWQAIEFYAFGGAQHPRILITGPAASRLAHDGDYRQCFTANQDRFKGAVVLTLEEAEDLGVSTIERTEFRFFPKEEGG